MSNTSEPSQNPLDALEALYAARRTSERPEPPRLAAINELAALARAPRPEPVRPVPVPPLGERIDSVLPESARRRIQPELVPEPENFNGGLRRKIVAVVIGVGAAVAVASVVTLLLVNVFPRDKDSADPAVTAAVAAPPQPGQTDADPKPVSQLPPQVPAQVQAQVQPPATTNDGEQNFNHEQSEQLLQQFMQWQQKAASSDKP
jgi:hypothetical protein